MSETAAISRMLLRAVQGHGVRAELRDGVVIVRDGLLLLAGESVTSPPGEGQVSWQVALRIEARVPHELRPIFEDQAALGDDADRALAAAFAKFMLGAFHVLLEAFVPHSCDSPQAEVEHWHAASCTWKVFVGAGILERSGESRLPATFNELLSRLRPPFESAHAGGIHWLSLFVGGARGEVIGAELRLDNERWPPGMELMRAQEWQIGNGYESLRCFVLMLPDGIADPRAEVIEGLPEHGQQAAPVSAERVSVFQAIAKQWSIVAMFAYGVMCITATNSLRSVAPLLALLLLVPLGLGIGAQAARSTRKQRLVAVVSNASLLGCAALATAWDFSAGGAAYRGVVTLLLLAVPAALHVVALYPRLKPSTPAS